MKNLFLVTFCLLALVSCSSDDNAEPLGDQTPIEQPPISQPPVDDSNIVINEFSPAGGWVELTNTGNTAKDVSNYVLCLGGGTYRALSSLPIVNLGATTTIAPGEFLVVEYSPIINSTVSGGLGLYINSSGFTVAANLSDFVQYGAAGSQRENVAVEAGIWTLGDFAVAPGAGASLVFDGEGNSSSDWSELAIPTPGLANDTVLEANIVINEFSPAGGWVELTNTGNMAKDVSTYVLCLGGGTYRALSSLPIVNSGATTTIAPGEFLVVEYSPITNSTVSGGLGLYINSSGFTVAANLSDFVQYGAAGSQRENVAVEAGIWTLGDFAVAPGVGASLVFDGEGNSSSDWSELATPTPGVN